MSMKESDDSDTPFRDFAEENREWLEEQADSNAAAAWVAEAILSTVKDDE